MLYWGPMWYTTWENIFLSILAILIIIIFWGVIYSFIWAIFLFIFSKWDENKIKKAINSIRYAIIGVILTVFLLFVFPIIFKKLQIPWYKVYTAQNIFKRASLIIKKVFTGFKNSYNENIDDLDTSL